MHHAVLIQYQTLFKQDFLFSVFNYLYATTENMEPTSHRSSNTTDFFLTVQSWFWYFFKFQVIVEFLISILFYWKVCVHNLLIVTFLPNYMLNTCLFLIVQSYIHSLEASFLTSITAMAWDSQAMKKDHTMTLDYSWPSKTLVEKYQISPISIAIY